MLFTLDETVFSREIAPLAGFYPRVYVGRAVVVPRRPGRDPPLPRGGHRDRRVLPHLRVHRRHPRVLLDPGPARHVPPARRGCLAELVAEHRLDEDEALETARRPGRRPTRGRRSSCDRHRTAAAVPLSRAAGHGRPAAPVRIVHLGLGNFFRAHQAWYTEHAPDAADWGIAAFTGRRAAMADALSAAGRPLHADHPRPRTATASRWSRSLSRGAPRGRPRRRGCGYSRPPGGRCGDHHRHRGRLPARRRRRPGPRPRRGRRPTSRRCAATRRRRSRTAPGRLVAGLPARRAADAGPLALVPCDNLPDNGAVLARVVGDLAQRSTPRLADWIDANVSFVTTMVDRITPGHHRRATARPCWPRTGSATPSPVVTEPFREWVLAGEFPAGRPAWDGAGAVVVDDIEPYEHRKLWLLNGVPLAAGLRRVGARPRDRRRGGGRPGVPRLGGAVVGRGGAAPPLPAADVAGLPRRAAGAVRQPAHPPPARPDRRRRVPEAAGPDPAGPARRAGRRSGPEGATRVLAAWVCHLRGPAPR